MHSENEEREHAVSQQGAGAPASASASENAESVPPATMASNGFAGQGSPCPDCGSFTIRQSGCFVCMSCGWSSCG